MFDQTFLVEKGHVSLRAPYRTDENNFRRQILPKYNLNLLRLCFLTENFKILILNPFSTHKNDGDSV